MTKPIAAAIVWLIDRWFDVFPFPVLDEREDIEQFRAKLISEWEKQQ